MRTREFVEAAGKNLVQKNEVFILKIIQFFSIIIMNDGDKFNASAFDYHTTAILVKLYYYKVSANLQKCSDSRL